MARITAFLIALTLATAPVVVTVCAGWCNDPAMPCCTTAMADTPSIVDTPRAAVHPPSAFVLVPAVAPLLLTGSRVMPSRNDGYRPEGSPPLRLVLRL